MTFEPFSVWSKGPEMFDGWVLTNTQRFGGEEDTLTRVIGRRSGDEPRQSASRSVPSGSWSLKGSIAAWESMTSGPSYQGGLEFMASSGASLRIQVEQPPAGGTGSPSPHVSAAWRGADGELGPLQVSLDVPLGIPGDEYATEVSFVLEVRGSALTLSVNEGEARDVSPAKGTGTALRSMTLYCANGTTRWRDFVFTGL